MLHNSYLSTFILLIQDLYSVDLERFQYGGTNITGFRLVNLDNSTVLRVMEEWQKRLDNDGLLNAQQCLPPPSADPSRSKAAGATAAARHERRAPIAIKVFNLCKLVQTFFCIRYL